jgi:C-terminal processing protease CtpA/Prc
MLAALIALPLVGERSAPPPTRADRLVALAHLDAAIRYFHPQVATGVTSWDSLFAANAVRIADAATQADYERAVAGLVDGLGDPATHVVAGNDDGWASRWARDSTLVVSAVPRARADARLGASIAKARAVVVDLRGVAGPVAEAALARVLLRHPVTAPPQRTLVYSGFPSVSFKSGYGLTWRVVIGERFDGAATTDPRVAFLVDARSILPALTLALRTEGRGAVVGVAVDSVRVAAERHRVLMGENVFVDVRLGDRVTHGSGALGPDTVIGAAARDAALIVARDWAQRSLTRVPAGAQIDTLAEVTPPSPPSSEEWRSAYPTVGYRILAAARLWDTIHLFYPYKDLMGESWDGALRAALPAFERAQDPLSYAQAIAEFASHIHDTHVSVASSTLRAFLGVVPIGAAARLIENQLVITRIADSSAARAGLVAGDVVVDVDGESVTARIARLTPYLASSTPQALRARLERILLSGPDTTPARLIVHGANGVKRTVVVPRSPSYALRLQKHRTGSIIRILPGNIGYADLDRLTPTMVDSMFRVLANTKAIVFDDRGYPLGTAWSLAKRLNIHPESTTAARFRRLVVPSPDTTRTTVYSFDQPLPPADNATKYSGHTVTLIDERTISQAEHTGLFLEAANGTTFIGSPTMGANGDVTDVALPGLILVTFSGHDVRHADGRRLQRLGLQPQVTVTPTISGIRAGHDEVLETALKYVGGTGEVPADTFKETVVAALAPERALTGWQSIGSGTAHRAGADQSVAHGGNASGHVTALSPATGEFGGFSQAIRTGDFRGKRVRFSAYVKTRSVQGTGAGLWMRIDGLGGSLAFDNMMQRPLTGTIEWTHASVVLDVAQDAVAIFVGLLLSGNGEAWIDDASFEVVGSDVPATMIAGPQPDPAHAKQQAAMFAALPLSFVNLDFEQIR